MMRKGKTIVLAERIDDVVIITPNSLNRARGLVAREVLVTCDIAGQLGYRDLWNAIEPCFATQAPAGVSIAGPTTTATAPAGHEPSDQESAG